MRFFAVAMSAALGLTSAHAQSVLVVDACATPTGTFASIQAAIDAAAPGDVVFVQCGTFPSTDPITIDRPLTLVADPGGVQLAARLHIEDVNTGSVSVRGFVWNPVFPFFESGELSTIQVKRCSSPVWIESCDSLATQGLGGGSALRVDESDAVMIRECHLETFGLYGNDAALHVFQSNVHVFESQIVGKDGSVITGLGHPLQGQFGANGLYLEDSTVYVQGSVCIGGDGGLAGGPACDSLGQGGHGARLWGSSTLRHIDSTFVGGLPGTSPNACLSTIGGEPILASPPGIATELPSAGYSLRLTPPVPRDADPLTLEIDGAVGDLVAIGLAVAPANLAPYFDLLRGPLLLDPATFVAIPLGAIPPSGTLTLPTFAAQLAGLPFTQTWHQPFGLGGGLLTAGPGVLMTVLDAGL